jgi:hypothetical protein
MGRPIKNSGRKIQSGMGTGTTTPGHRFSGKKRFMDALTMYEYMDSKATTETADKLIEFGYPATGEDVLVYRGLITIDAAKDLGLLNSAISHGMALLKAIRAITVLSKGNKYRPSIYLLHFKPTIEQYEQFTGDRWALERKTVPSAYDTVINQLAELRGKLDDALRRIAELEGARDNVRRSQAVSKVSGTGTGNRNEGNSTRRVQNDNVQEWQVPLE